MERRRSKRLNLKVAILLPVVLGLLGGGVYGLHQYQVKRLADKMLDRARRAEDVGNLEDAIRYYDYYLRYRPRNDQVFTSLALLLADRAKRSPSPEALRLAYQRLEAAAIRDPDNLEVIRRLADLSMQLQQYQAAEEHLRRLIRHFPDESELEVKLGRCQMATERYRDALASFERAIGRDPKNIDAYVELAALLRDKLDERDEAEAVIQRMVRANRASPRAYVERARFWKALQRDKEAKADLEVALEKGADHLDVLLTAAAFAVDDGELEKARQYLQRAEDLFPEEIRVQQALADLYRLQNDTENYRKYQERIFAKLRDPALLTEVAEAQLAAGDLPAVRQTLDKMRKVGFPREVLDYYEARVLLSAGKLIEAVEALERLRPRVAGQRKLALKIHLHLGACYEQLGLPDRQLEAFRRAVAEDPSLIPARIGYASALLATGKMAQALEEYRRLERLMGTEELLESAPLRNHFFRLLLIRNAQLPADQRDWTEAEKLVAEAERLGCLDPSEQALMRAELLVQKGQYRQARQQILSAQEERPEDPALWRALASVAALDEGPKAGLAILDEAAHNVGNSLVLELERARLAVRLDPASGKEVLAAVEQRVAELPEPDRPSAWQALGEAYYRLRDRPKAKELWTKAAEALPNDRRTRLALFDLAREADDPSGMTEAADALKRLLGERSAEWCYCQASRLIWQAQHQQAEPGVLEEAKRLLKTATELRPTWHELPRLEAEIALMENRVDDAIERFQRANSLGPLAPVHQGQLARLLFLRGRFSEAKAVLDQLGPARESPLLEKIEAEVTHRLGQTDEALKLAADNVAGSSNPKDFLWYGQLLARAGKIDEAEKALRRAIELDPKLPASYLDLVALLAHNGRASEAEEVIRQAQSQLSEAHTPLILAECYQILGKNDLAEKRYLEAVALQPDDMNLLRRLAEFYLRNGRADSARRHLSRLIELADGDPARHREMLVWARRTLAQVLAGSGEDHARHEALALLEQNASEGKLAPQDVRLQAAILARSGDRRDRLRAIALFESLQKENARLAPADQFLLAQLYERANRWTECRETMLELLAQHPVEAPYLVYYIEMLLAHAAPLEEIEPWLERLEASQPESPITKITKARVLSKAGRVEEALDQCEAALSDLPLASVLPTAVGILRNQGEKARPEDFRRVEAWFQRALQDGDDSKSVQLQLAALRDLQGRYDELTAIYRDFLARDDLTDRQRAIVWNNLAYVLAATGTGVREAHEMIGRAIDVAGPTPEMLDTRGVVYLAQGKVQEAIAEFRRAISENPSGMKYFHLALAQMAAGNREAAGQAMKTAQERFRLTIAEVPKLERTRYEKLIQDLRGR